MPLAKEQRTKRVEQTHYPQQPVNRQRIQEEIHRAHRLWKACLEQLKQHLSQIEVETWFAPLTPVRLSHDVFILRMPSFFYVEWIEEHYAHLLIQILRNLAGANLRLEYEVQVLKSTTQQQGTLVTTTSPVLPPNPYALPQQQPQASQPQIATPELNPRLTFETFVEGDCNRLARAAAIQVSQSPGKTSFNPLVIYGGTGLGKTHLLHAIGNALLRTHPHLRIAFTTGELFTSQFVQMARQNTVDDFLRFYYNVDCLLIDDIHLLAGKEKTQEVFFHIFNYLHQHGKQIVVTTDTPPAQMKGFTERLLSRLRWSLVAEIHPPDFSTRLAILKMRAQQEGITLPDEIFRILAREITGSIRELEGALISFSAHLLYEKAPPSPRLLLKVVKRIVATRASRHALSREDILRAICQHFGLKPQDLNSKQRDKHLVLARDLAVFLMRKHLCLSWKEIGVWFQRDHSWALRSYQRAEQRLKQEPSLQSTLQKILQKLPGTFSGHD